MAEPNSTDQYARGAVVDGRKRCSICREVKDLSNFHSEKRAISGLGSRCKDCNREVLRAWRLRNPDFRRKINLKSTNRKRRIRMGLDKETLRVLLSQQQGLCFLCGLPEAKVRRDGSIFGLSLDHNHQTGRIRGWLCHLCNAGLGCFKDDPTLLEKAAAYLRQHAAT